jgi:hypothetical protein
VDGEDGVVGVELAREENLDLQVRQEGAEGLHGSAKLLRDLVLLELQEGIQIPHEAIQAADRLGSGLEDLLLFQEGLGVLRVVPESFGTGGLLQLLEPPLDAGFVKDSSEVRRPSS